MRAMLLAAGLGTRLAPITESVPKCLVEISGRPLMSYWLDLLVRNGIEDILINLHYLPNLVSEFIENYQSVANIETAYEEKLLGTAGTLFRNIEGFKGEPVMVIHADNLSLFDLRAFVRRFEMRALDVDITMMTFRTDAPETCGIVEVDGEGIVRAFHEKVQNPPGNLANAAVYILAPSVVEFIGKLKKEPIDFSTEVLPHYIGKINTFENEVYHRDIGSLQNLELARLEYPAVAARERRLLALEIG